MCENEIKMDVEGVLRNFIDAFKASPCLWKPTDPSYMDKHQKNVRLDYMNTIYNKIKPGSRREDVKRKINTLRTNYRKELKKIELSKKAEAGADEIYKPKSWVFSALTFLDQFQQPVNLNPGNDENATEDDTDAIPEVSPSRSSMWPPSTPPEKKRLKSSGPTARENALLEKACSLLAEPDDKCPVITKAWGEILLSLDITQRILAEKGINDILFEARMGNLRRNSVRINEDGSPCNCSFSSS